MQPVQIATLIALVIGVASFVAVRVVRSIRADEKFFGSLFERLSDVLMAKGFTATGQMHFPLVSGAHIVTFEGSTMLVDLIWDSREREVLLQERAWDQPTLSAGRRLAAAYVRERASPDAYREAAELILTAAGAIGGAA